MLCCTAGANPPGGGPRHATPARLARLAAYAGPIASKRCFPLFFSFCLACAPRYGRVRHVLVLDKSSARWSPCRAAHPHRLVHVSLHLVGATDVLECRESPCRHRIASQRSQPAAHRLPLVCTGRQARNTEAHDEQRRGPWRIYTHGRCACPGRIAKESGSRGQ